MIQFNMTSNVSETDQQEIRDISNKIMDMANLCMAATVFGQLSEGLNFDIPTALFGVILVGGLYVSALRFRQKLRR